MTGDFRNWGKMGGGSADKVGRRKTIEKGGEMRRGERNFDGHASEISAGGERGRDASGDRGIGIRGNSKEGRRRTVDVGKDGFG